MRDSQISGVKSISLDVMRLLTSIVIIANGSTVTLAYNKSGLSVLEGVVNGRNYLHYWVHNHHTVRYYGDLLTRCVNKALSTAGFSSKEKDLLFSEKPFENPVEIKGTKFYLPTDGDLIHLVKQNGKQCPETIEYLSRSPIRIPLWKTRAEFEHLFPSKDREQVTSDFALSALHYAKKIFQEKIDKYDWSDTLIVKAKHEMQIIDPEDIKILIYDKLVSYTDAVPEYSEGSPNAKAFFYVYIPKEYRELIEECNILLQETYMAECNAYEENS